MQPCGLFIDLDNGFLAASPDGLIGADGIAEVKCPESRKNEEPAKAAELYNDRRYTGETPKLSTRHYIYYQIQGQLHITGREFCEFIVYANQKIHVQRIHSDNDFWRTEMEPLLTRFYNECVLPELVDSRLDRNMKIKDPPYILDAINKRKIKQKKINLSGS